MPSSSSNNVGTETVDQSEFSRRRDTNRGNAPGLLLIFSAGQAMHGPILLRDGRLEIGRGALTGVELRDPRMSRQHATVEFDGSTWTITDHGSRNGSAVDGEAITARVADGGYRLLRTGETLFLLCRDIGPFMRTPLEVVDGFVVGPRLHQVFDQIRRAAAAGVLHITGETGTGKEIAARTFHRLGPSASGPFIAVNCAAIPEGVAERLLFGARKGAFSGATADSDGYVQAADGGTLFLDEVGELDLSIQAKLLRVLETREVLALGASHPRKVNVQICSATHRELRLAVAEKKFREDLYYRLARPHVHLPPLRERLEDLPYLVERELRQVSDRLVPHASLIEACLLRPWPGNVRELIVEARDAASAAAAAGEQVVKAHRLSPQAGVALARGTAPRASADSASVRLPKAFPPREVIEQTLRACQGRVATAARVLGLHRTQLRRWLEKNQVDLGPLNDDSSDSGSASSD